MQSYLTLPVGIPSGSPGGPQPGLQGVCLPASCARQDVEVLARSGVARIQAIINSSHVTGVTLKFEDVRAVTEDKELFGKVFSLSRFSAIVMFVLAVVLATVLDLLGTVHIVNQMIFRIVKGPLRSKFPLFLSLLKGYINGLLGYGDNPSPATQEKKIESDEIEKLSREGKQTEEGDIQQHIPTSSPVDRYMGREEVFEIIADPTEVVTAPEDADVVEYVLEDDLEAAETGGGETLAEVVTEPEQIETSEVHTVDVHATHSDSYSGRAPPNTPVAGSSPRQGSQGGGGEPGLLGGAILGLGSQGGGGEAGLMRGHRLGRDTADSGLANLSG